MDEIWQLKRKEKALTTRALMLQEIRNFFALHHYLEVETPIRIPAPLPEAHIEALPAGGWFLQTSPEICMKRLLAAGYGRIFQICKCFRAGERGSKHVPEFTILEWYRKGANYFDLMDECEEMIPGVAARLGLGNLLPCRDRKISLGRPWERITVHEAFDRFAPVSLPEALADDSFEEIMVSFIEPHLGYDKPAFIYDYPLSHGALARTKEEHPEVAERFELYLGGIEIANGYSELTDPDEYRRRFDQENNRRKIQGQTDYIQAERFLEAIKNLPEAGGIALGIDRLAMLFTDTSSIDQVMAFTPEVL